MSTASKIDVVDGRYVVRGQIVNNGQARGLDDAAAASPSRRTMTCWASAPSRWSKGRSPPGGRTSFSQTLDDPPVGTTDIVPAVE